MTNKPTLDAIQMFAIDIKNLLQRAKVLLKSQNILNYNELVCVNMNGFCECISLCEDGYG